MRLTGTAGGYVRVGMVRLVFRLLPVAGLGSYSVLFLAAVSHGELARLVQARLARSRRL